MIKPILPAIILLWLANPLFSQKVINGRVLASRTKEPVPYANIGIPNSNTGTISNEDGNFSIYIPAEKEKDTLSFSAIGYATRRIPLSSANDNQLSSVLLSQQSTLLEAVTVSIGKQKKKTYWLGNRYNRGGNIYADSISAGAAMALLIENKYPSYHADLNFPAYAEKALLKISNNTLEEFKVRIRILDVDSITKLPGKDLLNENVIVTSHVKTGWLNFDLSSFKFRVAKPFFLVFEWIMTDSDRLALVNQYREYMKLHPEQVTIDTMLVKGEKIPYYSWHNFFAGTSFGVSPIPFSLDNYQCYYRNNSFGEWKRASAILTARILISNVPPRPSKKTGSPK